MVLSVGFNKPLQSLQLIAAYLEEASATAWLRQDKSIYSHSELLAHPRKCDALSRLRVVRKADDLRPQVEDGKRATQGLSTLSE
jgi:hypothetical protein